MHHPTDRLVHTMVFVTSVVEDWPEREITQFANLKFPFESNIPSFTNGIESRISQEKKNTQASHSIQLPKFEPRRLLVIVIPILYKVYRGISYSFGCRTSEANDQNYRIFHDTFQKIPSHSSQNTVRKYYAMYK